MANKTLDELSSLVTVRDYAYTVINNSNFNRADVNDLTAILILLDKKILDVMRSQDFKEYIGFDDSKKIIQEMVQKNNIKSGLAK